MAGYHKGAVSISVFLFEVEMNTLRFKTNDQPVEIFADARIFKYIKAPRWYLFCGKPQTIRVIYLKASRKLQSTQKKNAKQIN